MIRSLHNGISGLRSHQTRMDVISNNISNVNSIGFKRGRATFVEVLGQEMLGLGRTAGGSNINPGYIGQGVSVGSIDQQWSQGALQTTNFATDLALHGDGFFIANNGTRQLLTRDGHLLFNEEGYLVTSGGIKIQGWDIAEDGSVNMGKMQDVQINFDALAKPKETSNISIGGNLSANTEIGEEVTVSTVLFDSQGERHSVLMKYTKTGTNTWDVATELSDGTALGTTAIEFDDEGNLINPDPPELALTGDYPDTTTPDDIDVTISLANLKQYDGSTTATVRSNDGRTTGDLLGYSIDPSGVLRVNFSNGDQTPSFQLAVGTVNNPNGLEQLGDNFYGVTDASGDLIAGRAGQEIQTAIVAGALEMSNVDLAEEFTDMIIAQRGYQASARVITTSDELLQETMQLKR